MKILVTGCDGLLGNNLSRELLKRGHEVRAFIFKPTYNQSLDKLNIEKVYGNILEKDEVVGACNGCDAVIHAAASTDIWPSRKQMIRDVNIIGTKNVVEAVTELKMQRLIHVSSANSFGFGDKQKPGDENTHINRASMDWTTWIQNILRKTTCFLRSKMVCRH
jgi:dihydroflavonol-4-reductase